MRTIPALLTLGASLLALSASAASSNLGTHWWGVDAGFTQARVSGLKIDAGVTNVAYNLPVASNVDMVVRGAFMGIDDVKAKSYSGEVGLRAFAAQGSAGEATFRGFGGLTVGWTSDQVQNFPTEDSATFGAELGVELIGSAGVTTPKVSSRYVKYSKTWATTVSLEHMLPVNEKMSIGGILAYTREEGSVKIYSARLAVRFFL